MRVFVDIWDRVRGCEIQRWGTIATEPRVAGESMVTVHWDDGSVTSERWIDVNVAPPAGSDLTAR